MRSGFVVAVMCRVSPIAVELRPRPAILVVAGPGSSATAGISLCHAHENLIGEYMHAGVSCPARRGRRILDLSGRRRGRAAPCGGGGDFGMSGFFDFLFAGRMARCSATVRSSFLYVMLPFGNRCSRREPAVHKPCYDAAATDPNRLAGDWAATRQRHWALRP